MCISWLGFFNININLFDYDINYSNWVVSGGVIVSKLD